ncbi:hypothetical protein [Microbulbifer sp. MCCC 1A16149]|uniref:hypothetical protein n=1 Tax=Microbulbifer sp. MCCC 1A16149 TaxID=3411322 RepID=UPI003D118EC5
MLDAIKYSSLELRKHEGQCVPRGPSIERAKIERVHLPLCTLEFRAPRHAPSRRFPAEEYKLRTNYSLDHLTSIGGSLVPSDSWRKVTICWRRWAFYGPWFTGYMGDVGFSVKVIGARERSTKFNLLFPSALEVAIQGYLTSLYGHKVYDRRKRSMYYLAPVDWLPINTMPVPAVQLDVIENLTRVIHCRKLFFPVSKDRLAVVTFDYSQSCAGKREAVDAKISPQPMLSLIESIVSSIRMMPNPEFQAEIDEARAACTGIYSVSPECKPFKWPADVDRDGLSILEYREGRYQD